MSSPKASTTLAPVFGQSYSHLVWHAVIWPGSLIIFLGCRHMIPASFPHAWVLISLLGALGLTYLVQTHIFPKVAPTYNGGWPPRLQRTWLQASSVIMGFTLAYLVVLVSWVLAIPCFALFLFFVSRYVPDRRRKNRKANIFDAHGRVNVSGIRTAEWISLTACIFWVLNTGLMMVDQVASFSHPHYDVRIIRTQRHQSRGGASYTVQVSGWRGKKKQVEIPVSARQYQQLQTGQVYKLTTRRSLLGSERMVQIRKAIS